MHDKIIKLFFNGCPGIIYPLVALYVYLYIQWHCPGASVTFFKKDE